MKFPSLQALSLALKKVLLRFPLEIAFALTGTIAASVLIELSNLGSEAENFCIRLIMVANLGLVSALSGTLFSESRIYSATKKNLLRLLTVLLVTGFFFLLDPLKSQADILRYFLLALAFHSYSPDILTDPGCHSTCHRLWDHRREIYFNSACCLVIFYIHIFFVFKAS